MKYLFLFVMMVIISSCDKEDKEEFTFKIISPGLSEVFHNGDVIHIDVEVSHYVSDAEFYIDNERIGTSNEGKVEIEWTPVGLSGGVHTLAIQMYPADFAPALISRPLLFEYSTGEHSQGGIIFYLDESRIHGMAVAAGDLNYTDTAEFAWGPETFIGATDSADGDLNTFVLSNSGAMTSYLWTAFNPGYVYAGYDDWYVPSKTEMLKLLDFVSAPDNELTMNNSYWTSTECCRALACAIDFNKRKAVSCLKADSLFRIRPVRKF